MSENLTRRLIREHLVSGDMRPGQEVALKIDQTLTQDATGTMAYLEFESIGIPRVKTELSVSYIDHNCVQIGYRNADDHVFLQTLAKKYGIYLSKPGNGICHQVHMERFGIPGKTLLGSDSHTPTGGCLGMLAIGSGGLDVAMAMAGIPFHVKMPKVVNVRLHGQLRPWVSAKDIILEILRRISVKGGIGKVLEFSGEGISSLTVPQRATICNMGAETGATTSVFPADKQVYDFLKAQGRADCYRELVTGEGCDYDEVMDICLNEVDALVAQPHMPDRVVPVKQLRGMKIDQVFIGSCTNGSYSDLVDVARILKGRTVHPDIEAAVSCASKQVMHMLASNGYLSDLLASGIRVLECVCGPCAGNGYSPNTGGISVRTNNRNFEGRCGTKDAGVYLVSPKTAAMSALCGYLTDAQEASGMLGTVVKPEQFYCDDHMIIAPAESGEDVHVIKGPNIKGLPEFNPMPDHMEVMTVIKVGDNITTDHIIPAHPDIVQMRSNIPAISRFVFQGIDSGFAKRCDEAGSSVIVAAQNYGQGSSREHAALGPKYLGIKAVIAKSFARIHSQNLVNFGILPLEFTDEDDYGDICQGDMIELDDLKNGLENQTIQALNKRSGRVYKLRHSLSGRQVRTIKAGGLLRQAALEQEDAETVF